MTSSKYQSVMKLEDLPVGSREIIEIDNKSIGLFNVNGQIIAVLNVCPHEFAPVCKGRLSGTTAPSLPGEPYKWGRDGEILYCPWHGWEFDLLTGNCLTDHRKLRRFPTMIEDGLIYIQLSR